MSSFPSQTTKEEMVNVSTRYSMIDILPHEQEYLYSTCTVCCGSGLEYESVLHTKGLALASKE